jgi:hypothetical protein
MKKPVLIVTDMLQDFLEKLNAGRVRRKAGADSKKFPGDRFYSWFLPSPP